MVKCYFVFNLKNNFYIFGVLWVYIRIKQKQLLRQFSKWKYQETFNQKITPACTGGLKQECKTSQERDKRREGDKVQKLCQYSCTPFFPGPLKAFLGILKPDFELEKSGHKRTYQYSELRYLNYLYSIKILFNKFYLSIVKFHYYY